MGTRAVSIALVVFALAAVPTTASAVGPLLAKAKQAGYPAQNCQYCHVSKVPKKEEFKPEDLNERGKWLMTEKQKHAAKEISVEWLKDYPGGKEQK
jgi:hypothetical protein